jgi:hypothetical protein
VWLGTYSVGSPDCDHAGLRLYSVSQTVTAVCTITLYVQLRLWLGTYSVGSPDCDYSMLGSDCKYSMSQTVTAVCTHHSVHMYSPYPTYGPYLASSRMKILHTDKILHHIIKCVCTTRVSMYYVTVVPKIDVGNQARERTDNGRNDPLPIPS